MQQSPNKLCCTYHHLNFIDIWVDLSMYNNHLVCIITGFRDCFVYHNLCQFCCHFHRFLWKFQGIMTQLNHSLSLSYCGNLFRIVLNDHEDKDYWVENESSDMDKSQAILSSPDSITIISRLFLLKLFLLVFSYFHYFMLTVMM